MTSGYLDGSYSSGYTLSGAYQAITIDNAGTIAVTSGAFDLNGALLGFGSATIGTTGTLARYGAVTSTATIEFAGTSGGALSLDDLYGPGSGFAAAITELGGGNEIDLAGFGFSAGPQLTWSQNGDSGTLTTTDGSKVANITLFGQYMTACFTAAMDAGTGTLITYDAPPQSAAFAKTHH